MSSVPTLRVIILVHGTFARGATWTKMEGTFCKILDRSLPGTRFVPFTWDGRNSHKSRIVAARGLAHEIERLASEADLPIYLVGHSHGGNVCIAGANLCRAPDRVKGLILLSTPFLNFEHRSSWLENLSYSLFLFSSLYVLWVMLFVNCFPASFDWLLSSMSSSVFTRLLPNESDQFLKGAWSVLCYVSLIWLVLCSINAGYNSTRPIPPWSPIFQFVRPKVLVLNHGLDEAYWFLKFSALLQRTARTLLLALFATAGMLPLAVMFIMFFYDGTEGFLHHQVSRRVGFMQTFLIPALIASFLALFGGAIALIIGRLIFYPLPVNYAFGLTQKRLLGSAIRITRLPKFVWSREALVWLDRNQIFFGYAKTLNQSLRRRSLIHSFAYVEPVAMKSIASWIRSLESHIHTDRLERFNRGQLFVSR